MVFIKTKNKMNIQSMRVINKSPRSIIVRATLTKKLIKQLPVFLLACSPSLALAYDGSSDVISSVLRGLIELLASTPARLMFVVAIIGVGYGTLALGKIPKERAVSIVVGIGIVFSASYIAQKMGLGG